MTPTMLAPPRHSGSARPRVTTRRGTRARRAWGTGAALAALVVVLLLSLSVGSNPISVDRVWHLLLTPDSTFESAVVTQQRLPRTLLVAVVGAALAVSGTLMQSLTRNPLAEPGVLGVNAGASLAVVVAVAVLGVTSIWSYLWFAFAGAAAAAVLVYVLAGAGGGGATPARLALAGVALSMAISSLVQSVILADQNAYNEFRYWAAGSAQGRGFPVLWCVLGFIVVGLLLAHALGPSLNALALGEDTGRGLGVRVGRVRALVLVAVTLLAGSATAAVGPIMFVGLGVPYLARAVCGPDQRWVIPFSALAGPVALLAADVLARVVTSQ